MEPAGVQALRCKNENNQNEFFETLLRKEEKHQANRFEFVDGWNYYTHGNCVMFFQWFYLAENEPCQSCHSFSH